VGVGGLWCGAVVFYSLCCCFRFAVHNFLGAVCWFLCLAFAWFLLLLLVVACAGESHFFGCFLHWLSVGFQIGWLMVIILRLY
jgi:hypothetical protein